jgi:hypothetical protein
MYGASAQLVITMKGGSVNGFTLVSPAQFPYSTIPKLTP